MKNPLLLLLVLLALGGLGYLLVAGGGEVVPDPTVEADTDTPPGGDPPTTPDAVDPGGATETGPGKRRELEFLDSAAELRAEESIAEGLLVEVVEKKSKAPVAGATVLFMEEEKGQSSRGFWSYFNRMADIGEAIKARGRKFRTDDKGQVRVPKVVEGRAWLVGAHRNLWAFRGVGKTTKEPVRLLVEPDKTVRIQVVDGKGKPVVGVPVGLQNADRNMNWTPVKGVTAGPEGIAVLEHLQLFEATFGIFGRAKKINAVLDIPLAEPVATPVDLKTPPAEPIRLVLPATGRVEVVVREEGKTVGDGEVRVSLAPKTPSGRGDRSRIVYSFWSGLGSKPVKGGRVVYPFVGLGLELVASGTWALGVSDPFMHMGRKASREEGLGPQAPGQKVILALGMKPRPPILTGRALGADGKPLAGIRLQWRIDRGTRVGSFGRNSRQQISTDGAGRFRIQLGSDLDGKRKQTLSMAVADGDDLADKTMAHLRGKVDITRRVETGVEAVGDVPFRLPPVVAQGVVVDERGEPVAGARVTVSVQRENRTRYRGNRPARIYWSVRNDLAATTDAKGVFTSRGDLAGQPIRLQPSCAEHLEGERMESVAGTRDLRLTLARAGGLSGSVVLPPLPEGPGGGGPFRPFMERNLGISVVVEHRDAGVPRRYRQVTRLIQKGGDFTIASLAPGLVDVSLVLNRDRKTPLRRIDGIRVEPGTVVRDPRLQKVDLRGAFQVIRLTFRRPDGKPLFEEGGAMRNYFSSQVRIARGPEFRNWEYHYGGTATLFTPTVPVDLDIDCKGFRVTRVLGVSGDREVVLQPELSVTLALPEGVGLPAEPAVLAARLSRVAEAGSTSGSARSFLSGRGASRWVSFRGKTRVAARLKWPGKYTVQWYVRIHQGKGYSSHRIPEKVFTLTVTEAPDQVHALTLDPAKVEGAIEQARTKSANRRSAQEAIKRDRVR